MSTQRCTEHRAARAIIISLLALGSSVFSAPAQAGPITFAFDFSNNTPGVGFDDAVLGAARKAALQNAAVAFSNMFGSYFSNIGTIFLEVTSSDDNSLNTLASAGSFYTSPGTSQLVGEVILNKLQTGVDLNGADNDGTLDVNWGYEWELDENTPASSTAYDFYAALAHEFTHALGFANTIGFDGDSVLFPGTDQWAKYDTFLADKFGNKVINPDFSVNLAVWNAIKTGDTGNGAFFAGPKAVAANGGSLVALYSPAVYSDGSSIGHLDKAIFPTEMMKHDRDTGPQEARAYGQVEVGIMTDLGYTRNAATVPEPATVGLMLVGVVGVLRRRQRA